MRKTSTKLTEVTIQGGQFWCVTWPKPGKGRNRQFFKDKSEAKTFLGHKLIEQENYGISGMAFNLRQRAEYLECAEKLAPFNTTLRDAVNFYLPHLQATNRSCTAKQLVEEIVKAKTADGGSKRYMSDLRIRLKKFADDFDGKQIAEFTTIDIDQWLRGLTDSETGKPVAAITRNNFRQILNVAFNFAHNRGYCASNPVGKTAKAKVIETPAGILTVEQTARLLEKAHKSSFLMSRLVPSRGYGGLSLRLDWKEIDLQSRLIEVTASKAKSARRLPVIASFSKARRAAGIEPWPINALRHSFASYYLAHFRKAGVAELALEMGHTSANLVFQHYRELVKPKDAKRYWNILPAAKQEKIIVLPKPA